MSSTAAQWPSMHLYPQCSAIILKFKILMSCIVYIVVKCLVASGYRLNDETSEGSGVVFIVVV